jgi:hypothetical protein
MGRGVPETAPGLCGLTLPPVVTIRPRRFAAERGLIGSSRAAGSWALNSQTTGIANSESLSIL